MPYQPIRSALSLLLLVLFVPVALCAAAVPAGPEISVRVAQAGSAWNPLVGVFPDGGFVVAWTTGSPTSVLHARLFDASGAPASGEYRVVQPYDQLLDSLAVTKDGGFVLVWEQPRAKNRYLTSLLARRFDRQGNPTTAAFVVHEPSPLSVYGGTVAATADGGFAIAWTADQHDSSDPNAFLNLHRDTFVRSFAADGSPKGPAKRVAMGSIADDSYLIPAAMKAASDGTLVLVSDCYCDQPGMTLHLVTPIGDVFPIDTVPFDSDELQLTPTLAIAADGSFVIAWATGAGQLTSTFAIPSAIKGRRYAADGTPAGGIFQVNRRGGFEVYPHLAAFSGGGFVVTWTDQGGRDGSGMGIFSRSYAADGSTAGPDARVNLGTAGDQLGVSLAAAGQAVAVWLAPGPVVSSPQIHYQRIQARRLTPS